MSYVPHKAFEPKVKNKLIENMSIASSNEVPEKIKSLFDEALEVISPYVEPLNTNVIFCTDGILTIRLTEQIGMHIPNLIVLDVSKLMQFKDHIIVTCILEEFAHCLRGITDETEVGHYVASIYPKVKFDGKVYH